MMRYKKIAIVLMFLFSGILAYSQTKNEKEERIKMKTFPANALEILNTLPKNIKRIKYYKERNDTIISYEAKLKLNKKSYSIEFNKNGELEDVEITINFNNTPDLTKTFITDYLKINFDDFEIIKIQKQFKNELNSTATAILNDAILNTKEKGVYYELVVATHKSTKIIYKEFTFNDSGSYVSEQNITLSSSDYVQY